MVPPDDLFVLDGVAMGGLICCYQLKTTVGGCEAAPVLSHFDCGDSEDRCLDVMDVVWMKRSTFDMDYVFSTYS